MARLDDELSAAKKALDELGVRDLLRRDWKGDLVKTADGTPDVHVGFASVPLSLEDQVERTLYNTTDAWFGVLDGFSNEIGVDVTISLHSYKSKRHEDGHPKGGDVLRSKKIKVREMVLAVRPTDNVSDAQATQLFDLVSKTLEESPFLDAERWADYKSLKPRQ
jgi:exopolyphosphatase